MVPLSFALSSAADSDLGVIGDDDRDLERSNPIRISNKNLSDEMEVNVDLESFESVSGDGDVDGDPYGVNVGGDGSGSGENFDYFDLILESSRDATEMQQDRDRIRGSKSGYSIGCHFEFELYRNTKRFEYTTCDALCLSCPRYKNWYIENT